MSSNGRRESCDQAETFRRKSVTRFGCTSNKWHREATFVATKM
jgi:hypothetical protein